MSVTEIIDDFLIGYFDQWPSDVGYRAIIPLGKNIKRGVSVWRHANTFSL
jgi:hypothetical protein